MFIKIIDSDIITFLNINEIVFFRKLLYKEGHESLHVAFSSGHNYIDIKYFDKLMDHSFLFSKVTNLNENQNQTVYLNKSKIHSMRQNKEASCFFIKTDIPTFTYDGFARHEQYTIVISNDDALKLVDNLK